MNLEDLVSKYKNNKIGDPDSAVAIEEIPESLLKDIINQVVSSYDLTDEKYITKENVFYDTRRIVARNNYNQESKQLYTNLDFDDRLIDISKMIIPKIEKFLPSSVPVLLQLATILPGQRLKWHIDVFFYQQFTNKLHIPLIANSKSFFDTFVNHDYVERINMVPGLIYNINNLALHRSINIGDTPRTHLIIDMIEKATLEALIISGINFFHTRFPIMSDIERDSLEKLALKVKK